MPKNNRTKAYIIISSVSIAIILLSIFAKFVTSTTLLKAADTAQVKAMTELKDEGCIPARQSEKDIGIIKEQICEIDEKLDKQDVKLDAILEKI